MNVGEWLKRSALQAPQRMAVFHGATPFASYQVLHRRAMGLAAALRSAYGVGENDRVGLFLPNNPSYLEILFATWWLGAITTPINAKLHEKEAAWIIKNAGCRVVFTTTAVASSLADLIDSDVVTLIALDKAYEDLIDTSTKLDLVPRGNDDLAWLFYTSGTTGRPKGVMITHGNLATMTACYFIDVDTVTAADATLYAAPMSHGAGFYSLPHVLKGASHIVPSSGSFDPEEVIELAQVHSRVSMFLAPTMVNRLIDKAEELGYDGVGIKTIIYGGGPMYTMDIERALRVLGQRFVQIYGQGESPMTITALNRERHQGLGAESKLTSVGSAQALVEVRVASDNGCSLPAGEIGEVQVRGPSVMAGYWRDQQATEEALSGGWLHTGDLGELDDMGFLTLRGRSKEVIISGGTNIYPREVENVLVEYPEVLEAAVVGRGHAEWGEEVVAFIVISADIDLEQLDEFCKHNIARFKRPREYIVVDSLPKNNYGKVMKKQLVESLRKSHK